MKLKDIYPPLRDVPHSTVLDREVVDVYEMSDSMLRELHETTTIVDVLNDAIKDLDEVEELLARVTSGLDEGAVLSPLSVVPINSMLRRIHERHGINTEREQQIVSVENFSGSINISHRLSNSQIVVEALSDKIASAWGGIKKGLSKIWTGITNFWKKHLSTLSSLEGSIERAISEVNKRQGSPNMSAEAKVPGGLAKAFNGTNNVNPSYIDQVITRHRKANKAVLEIVGNLTSAMSYLAETKDIKNLEKVEQKFLDDMNKNLKEASVEFASEKEPLVSGMYGRMKIDVEENFQVKLEIDFDKASGDDSTNETLKVGEKQDLINILERCKVIVKETKNLGREFELSNKVYNKSLRMIEDLLKKVDGMKEGGSKDEKAKEEGTNSAKQFKFVAEQISKTFRLVAQAIPNVNSRMASLNITLVKSTVNYSKVSLKNYMDDTFESMDRTKKDIEKEERSGEEK